MRIGVHTLPKFPKDTTDRNRTSPFAFTGNKFEFRMLGSSASISGPNTVINTAVAEVLKQFADELESAPDFEKALHSLIKRVISQHKRIIFNGNGYDDTWLAEAEKRGLLNLKTTPDALPYFITEKSVALFTAHKVYTERELRSHYNILTRSYCNLVGIEAKTMVDMTKKDILPAVSEYSQVVGNTIITKRAVCESLNCVYETEMLKRISSLVANAYESVQALENALEKANALDGVDKLAIHYRDEILPTMSAIRKAVDELETIVSAKFWPMPTYGDLLFGV